MVIGYIFISLVPLILILYYIIKRYQYQKYINSISVGDIFKMDMDSLVGDDPFEEEFDYSESGMVIIDIKKNNKGETWVKYKRLKDGGVEYTDEIHTFVYFYKRIKQSES